MLQPRSALPVTCFVHQQEAELVAQDSNRERTTQGQALRQRANLRFVFAVQFLRFSLARDHRLGRLMRASVCFTALHYVFRLFRAVDTPRSDAKDSVVLSKHSRCAISRVQMHIRVWTHQVRHKGLNGLYVGVD